MSSPYSLPSKPNLRQLRNQSRDLLKAHQAAVPEAANRLRQALTELVDLADEEIFQNKLALKDAQRAIAREYGFETWAALKHHIESASERPDNPLQRFERQVKELAGQIQSG